MSKATFDPRKLNLSANTPFADVLEASLSRRSALKGGTGIAAFGMFSALGLTGCGSEDNDETSAGELATTPDNVSTASLGFESIPGSLTDAVTVAAGYTASVLAPWGTPLNSTAGAWQADGSNTATDQANSVGMHHDGMHFFPLNADETDGLLCINHEYLDQSMLHPDGTVYGSTRADADDVRKEINAHGVSVVRIQLTGDTWSVVENDSYNRRFTGATPMDISGPVTDDRSVLITPYSTDGTTVRGTLNNCGNGYTPWGTYLSCEENWPAYFKKASGYQSAADSRLGLYTSRNRYYWDRLAGDSSEVDGEFSRFDTDPISSDAATDYRNEANGHGYIVEIDPYDSSSRAVKRTALGRIRHEGCVFGKLTEGEPVVFYTGHDGRFEYMYKFVSDAMWDPADASPSDRLATGAKYMDSGTLYVMRFNSDGTGEWIPLVLSTSTTGVAGASVLGDIYSTLGEMILNTPGAADAVGATPMDRPEWCAVDRITGSVYLTLTNNTKRDGSAGTNPANPRLVNTYGHIIRWDEGESAESFTWDIFVFGAPSDDVDSASYNLSGLTEMNQFASPDGLLIDSRGIMWIQTDNGADAVEQYTNDQMLAVIPSKLRVDGEQQVISADNQDALRRFFVGPNGCEVTGLATAGDNTSFFANIQHPTNWPYSTDATEATPAGETVRARAATVVFRKTDGGAIGE